MAVERVQTGIRFEKRILKVLKGIAEYKDISLTNLLEGMILHCFEGKLPFQEDTIEKINALKHIYGLDLTYEDSHKLEE